MRRLSPKQLTWQIALYALLIILAIIYIYPFLIQVATSFKTDEDAASSGITLIPDVWTFAAYERLFRNSDFPSWFVNSAIVTIFVTAGRVFFNSLAGYALARLRFRGRGVVFAALVAVMSVPTVVLLIPKFLVINQLTRGIDIGARGEIQAMVNELAQDGLGSLTHGRVDQIVVRGALSAFRVLGACDRHRTTVARTIKAVLLWIPLAHGPPHHRRAGHLGHRCGLSAQ